MISRHAQVLAAIKAKILTLNLSGISADNVQVRRLSAVDRLVKQGRLSLPCVVVSPSGIESINERFRGDNKKDVYGWPSVIAIVDNSSASQLTDEIDGNEIITGVSYDGEDIDNWGGDTSGKSSDFGFYIAGSNKQDGKGYERYRNMDDIVYPMTDWFPKKIKPVREGVYNVKTAGKNSYTYQARWKIGRAHV